MIAVDTPARCSPIFKAERLRALAIGGVPGLFLFIAAAAFGAIFTIAPAAASHGSRSREEGCRPPDQHSACYRHSTALPGYYRCAEMGVTYGTHLRPFGGATLSPFAPSIPMQIMKTGRFFCGAFLTLNR
jgi:hypothetical protein